MITEDVLFEEMETASAIVYAAARRYCLRFEENPPLDEETIETIGDASCRLIRAVDRLDEARARWQASSRG